MKHIERLLLLAVFVFAHSFSFGQADKETAKWSHTCKKLSGNEYELVFHLDLKKGWHVFTETDNIGKKKKKRLTLVIPHFAFDANKDVKLKDTIASKGLLETKNIKHVGLVNIYSFKVLYTQILEATPGAKLTGSYTYQLCDDEEHVLPPVTERFVAELK